MLGRFEAPAMRLPRVRFKIWWLMLAVAIVAVLLAWLDVVNVIALTGMALVFIVLVAIAPRGRRLEVACWVVSLQPVLVVVYLYATWVTAWCVLGHRPRPSLDHANYISPIVDVPYSMTQFSLLLLPISVGAGIVLASGTFAQRSGLRPLEILPWVWLSMIVALGWDPLGVVF